MKRRERLFRVPGNTVNKAFTLFPKCCDALIASSLIQAGKQVLLVDRRDVCNGSSAASTAMLQYEIDEPLHTLIEQRGLSCAVESYRQCEKAIFTLQDLAEKIADYTWAGTFGETEDGLPYMGRPQPERKEHYILGFGGNGITFSVMGMAAILHSLAHTSHNFLQY